MEKFCLFTIHEYMDMYPEKYVRTFVADDESAIGTEARKWAKHMNENYSGGTTTFIKVMTRDEAKKYAQGLIDDELKHQRDDSEEFITHIMEVFDNCYGGSLMK